MQLAQQHIGGRCGTSGASESHPTTPSMTSFFRFDRKRMATELSVERVSVKHGGEKEKHCFALATPELRSALSSIEAVVWRIDAASTAEW